MSWYASLVLLLCRCQWPRQVFAASSRGLGLSRWMASLEWPQVSESGNFVYLDGSDIFWRKRTRSVFSSKQKKTSVHENVNNFFSQFHHEAAAANKYSEMQLEALLLRFHSPLIKQLFSSVPSGSRVYDIFVVFVVVNVVAADVVEKCSDLTKRNRWKENWIQKRRFLEKELLRCFATKELGGPLGSSDDTLIALALTSLQPAVVRLEPGDVINFQRWQQN